MAAKNYQFMRKNKSPKLTYQEISGFDNFFSTNNNSEKLADMFRTCMRNVEDAETPAGKFRWMEMSAKLNLVIEQADDILKFANEQLSLHKAIIREKRQQNPTI